MPESKRELKVMDGVPIMVDPDTGKFSARIGNKTIERVDLKEIEREIRRLRRAVKVIAVGNGQRHGPFVWEIIAFEREQWLTAEGRSFDASSYSIYPYSDGLLEALQAIKVEDERLAELNRELNTRWHDTLRPHQAMWRQDLPWARKTG